MYKKTFAILIVMMMSLTAIAAFPCQSSADADPSDVHDMCSGYYVGPECTADGTTLVGQTADVLPSTPGAFVDVPAEKGNPRTVTIGRGFEYRMPADTHQFSLCSMNVNGKEIYAGNTATNSVGYSFIGCVTILTTSQKALEADPFVPDGLGEDAASYIMAACCGSAREGAELFCSIIEQRGARENGIFFSVDRGEAWMIEVYTGHQYAAVKLPRDRMMVVGNESVLRTLDGYADRIVSDRLESLPREKGFAVYSGGSLDLKKTYAQPNTEYSHLRTWIGHKLFSAEAIGDFDVGEEYEPFFVPKQKVSLKEIMQLTRNRYEGTQYCPETTGAKSRVIGVESMSYANILQVRGDLPPSMCMVRWSCIGPTEFGVYIPISNAVCGSTKEYGSLGSVSQLDPSSAYGKFKSLNTLCSLDRSMFKRGVSAYWSAIESYYIDIYPRILDTMKGMSEGDAARYATYVALRMERDACNDADRLLSQCLTFHAIKDKSVYDVPEFPGCFDVLSYSEKYGWEHSVEEGKMAFTHGGRTIVLTLVDKDNELDWEIAADGTTESFMGLYWDGKLSIPMKYASLFSCEDPVNVYEPVPSGGSPNYLPLVVSVAAAILLLLGVAYALRRYQRGMGMGPDGPLLCDERPSPSRCSRGRPKGDRSISDAGASRARRKEASNP